MRGQVSETQFFGAITRREFGSGEELRIGELVKPGDRQFLAAVLKPGTRAVSISVDAPQSAAGLVLPGDHVDVILTQNFGDAADPSHKSVGEVVLRAVRVIAIDQSLGVPAKGGTAERGTLLPSESRVPKTVTLELKAQQAVALLVAAQLGRLQLSMRALEGAGAELAEMKRDIPPTWASDVSPALRTLEHKQPEATASTSTVEKAVRRPPKSSN